MTRPALHCRTRAPLLLGSAILMMATALARPGHAREDGAPAAALGLGDAVRSSATGAAGLYFNPAGMGMNHQYSFEAGYSYTGDQPGHAIGASAVDSKTNPALAMGMAYTFITSEEGGGSRHGHRIRGGLAAGHAWDSVAFSVGLGIHYLNLKREFAAAADPLNKDPSFLTIDSGLILEIARVIRLGVVGQNLIDTKTVTEAPRKVGFGLTAILGKVEISFDTDLDLQTEDKLTPSYSFGTQALLGGSVVTRTGFILDNILDEKRVTVGLGYVSSVVAGDFALAKAVDHGGGWTISLGLRYFMP
ncbi:MAG: hypothetical protein H6744_11620 [Deltaproteobacteria bacterium]|nr:hypothetical protein [Deltaproteobacteria bacterium]MCB9787325.1 hypothetical protein [Deltaproteobacteria bacterium]